ncbi:hypothetical protein B0H11DRAFT_2215384 [Mycena galericulata]|nr:hypothetical protein B0H11DRAFT_2215384 [Mycena galericulata]
MVRKDAGAAGCGRGRRAPTVAMTATETSGRVLYSRKDPRKLVPHRPALHSHHAARTSRTRPTGTNPCLALRGRLAEVSDDADAPALLRSLFACRNPLDTTAPTYEAINRDSALRVCEAFLASEPPASGALPFVFISAADVFRQWVPEHYTETKRDAGTGIAALMATHSARFRGVYLRPGLPRAPAASTPAAALLDASVALAEQLATQQDGSRAKGSKLP